MAKFEVIFILALIALQIYVFANVLRKIRTFKTFFPKSFSIKIKKVRLLNSSISSSKQLDEFLSSPIKWQMPAEEESVDLLEAPKKDKNFFEVIKSTNSYLYKNKGAAADFSILKDISERHLEKFDNEIGNLINVPLYIGLGGTFVGIIIGLWGIDFASTTGTVTIDSSSISQLLHGVITAMCASLAGLIFTVINSVFYKTAAYQNDTDKNNYYDLLQRELLPSLNTGVSKTIGTFKDVLNRFIVKFGENNEQIGFYNAGRFSEITDPALLELVANTVIISSIEKRTTRAGQIGQHGGRRENGTTVEYFRCSVKSASESIFNVLSLGNSHYVSIFSSDEAFPVINSLWLQAQPKMNLTITSDKFNTNGYRDNGLAQEYHPVTVNAMQQSLGLSTTPLMMVGRILPTFSVELKEEGQTVMKTFTGILWGLEKAIEDLGLKAKGDTPETVYRNGLQIVLNSMAEGTKIVKHDSRFKEPDILTQILTQTPTNPELLKLQNELEAAKEELARIREIEKTVNNINKEYFSYDSINKKHILNMQFGYPTGISDITKIVPDKRPDLLKAGKTIKELIEHFPEEDNIKYLVVVEGQASNDGWNGNDDLSYHRAQSLVNFWKANNVGLDTLKNCEIIIAGSGVKGIPREQPDIPPANQRFLITIIPKIGEMKK